MATRVRKAEYYSMKVPNRPGAGAKLLETLKAEGVGLLAFTGFPVRGGVQVDFIPQNGTTFRRAAKRAGWKVSPRKTVFLMQGDDRVGALTGVLGKLAAARISLTALDAAMAGGGRYGAMFWVKKKDVARAARLLRAR
jgi:prephenate dehydratase